MPYLYVKDKFVTLLLGFHTELTIYKILGQWLECSGWVEVLVQADVASLGTAESCLHASHVIQIRNAHQVTACARYILMKSAYQGYIINNFLVGEQMDFTTWCNIHKK
jgi:hypothetical protein